MKLKLAILSLGLSVAVINCKQDELIETNEVSSKPSSERVAAVYGEGPDGHTVTFNRSNQNYNNSLAGTDFGNIDNLREAVNTKIENNTLKVRIPKNTWSDSDLPVGDGLRFNTDIDDGSEYELSYKIKFDSNFKWSAGGKSGPGLVIGKGNSGCSAAIKDGAGIRVMWDGAGRKENEINEAYFQPYLYYVDKNSNCGDNFGAKSDRLKKNVWYTVYMRVKCNTGSSDNGSVFVSIKEGSNAAKTLYSDSRFRWTNTSSTDSNRLVKELSWNTFRGGKESYWASSTDDYIYYDDIKWRKIN
ncbi:MAG: hypothetical protein MUF58_10885 [Arcicella sp.]|jgi:hypothetical protein|nr:hypothetical protein [Arcicella sp.]